MSQTSDQRFWELAMKLVSFECSAEEKAALRRIIDENPALREELQKLCLSVGIARELLPLIDALEATDGRMSTREKDSFKASLAQRREEQRRQSEALPDDNADNGNQETKVIDAEVVPGRSINGYKLGFYALLLLVLIVVCVVLVKSCGPTKVTPRQVQSAPTVVPGNPRNPTDAVAVAPSQVQQPAESTPPKRVETAQTPRVTPETSKPAPSSKLRNYRGSKWTKLADGNAKPGNNLYFRQFIGPNLNSLIIEGMRAPNGKVPKDFMLFSRQGGTWVLRSYPSVVTEAKTVMALDPTTIVVADSGFSISAYLIENGQALAIHVPRDINCISAHRDTQGTVFLHDAEGAVFRFSNGSGSWMDVTDPKAYIHDRGSPTEMRRGAIHYVAQADSGETVGVFYRNPPGLGPASFVRFNGEIWELVCSLGENYPGPVTHYLSGDSMIAAFRKQFLIVNGGVTRTLGLPDDVEAAGGAKWRGIRAASPEEFIAVETTGVVYHYANGRFDRQVERDPVLVKDGGWQGDGEGGLRSVLITPEGTIYGIQSPTRWSKSILYQLVPQ